MPQIVAQAKVDGTVDPPVYLMNRGFTATVVRTKGAPAGSYDLTLLSGLDPASYTADVKLYGAAASGGDAWSLTDVPGADAGKDTVKRVETSDGSAGGELTDRIFYITIISTTLREGFSF
jgi:hypothetical protein